MVSRHFSQVLQRCMLVMLTGLSACSYILPDDPSAPRYNSISGSRHLPQRNKNMVSEESLMLPAGAMVPAPTPLSGVPTSMPMPQSGPVATNAVPPGMPAPSAAAPAVSPSTNTASSDTVSSAAIPAPGMPTETRRVPNENPPLEMAQNSGTGLASVPPAPTVSMEETNRRLTDAKQDMEQDRARAQQEKEMLLRDAAAEPGMLSGLPESQGAVPPLAPVSTTPLPPPGASLDAPRLPAPPLESREPMGTPKSSGLPSITALERGNSFTPPQPMTPEPTSGLAPVETLVSPPPISMREAGLAPIRLRPPGSVEASLPTSSSAMMSPVSANASGMEFDPLAVSLPAKSAPANVYASTGYLPASRYAERH